eukprot:TRINITY_DN168_c0_g1_i7.p1 TRINITY_DN168_c0_g1~~TRINITY_DN168_c0_g1_i7.p1  ORF type:complete len:944 (-),score=373.37 TRINITY_DN168_c0_g1_i7:176-3007(-)
MCKLFEATSFEEIEVWIEKELKEKFEKLKEGEKEQREDFGKKLTELKRRLHPATNDAGLVEMFKEYHSLENEELKRELGIKIVHAQRIISESPQTEKFSKLFGKLEREFHEVAKLDMSAGKSNRAKRAKKAESLFSSAAGFLLPDGAEVDENGNALGEQFDLGVKGAFNGLKVVVLRQYNFDFSFALKALQRKGFEVVLLNRVDSAAKLQMELDTANQFWLIGSSSEILKEDEIEVIVSNWKDGMGMYIFGDNKPFYVDTNRVLTAMGLPTMTGNYVASKYLSPYDEATGKGYATHLVTTGISQRLYEGITIAEFQPKEVKLADCQTVMYNSQGGISVILREAQDGCGQVIADGAFTKLYCKFDAAGSDRFVRNCACWLAADFGGIQEEEKPESEDAEEEVIDFDYQGSFVGECDVTFEEGPLSIMAIELGDLEQNTSDYILDDPLGHGRSNMILGQQAYGVKIAMDMLAGGMDPFRRTPAMAVIPAVSLGNKTNFKLMTEIICKVFMAGKNLPKYAWMIFYGVCDEMAGQSETEHKKIWEYFCDEMLKHVYSTPDFTDMGKQVPLLKAMETFGGATDEMEQLRKSFTTTCLMARALFRKDVMSVPKLVPWVRHALIKVIAGIVLNLGKKKDEDKKNKAWFDDQFDNKHYDRYYGICLNDSAHVLPLKESLKWFIPAFKAIEASLDRVCNTLGVEEILNDNQVAVLLSVLRFKWNKNKLAKYTLENFMTAFLDDVDVKKVWKGETVDPTELLNERFEGFFHPKDEKYNPEDLPAFITPFGCSCFVSRCGETKFGDWTNEITEEESEKIKQVRNEYLKSTYGTDDPNGYPTAKNKKHTPLGSAHYPFHRGVQRVMTRPEFKEDKEVNEKHIKAICEYLLKQKKGDFYFRGIENVMKKGVESYLVCRRKGMVEPGHDEPINFFKKLQEERQARLSGLTDDIPAFV